MRLSDNRYSPERRQCELALRMIHHEARTGTIRDCTGLSDDRIRSLHAHYFGDSKNHGVRRRRGKSPQQISLFVKNPANQIQAGTLVALFCANLLLRIDEQLSAHPCWPRPDVEFGHRLCRAYEHYRMLHRAPKLDFEWTWNLLRQISYNDELTLSCCGECSVTYVQDAYGLDDGIGPCCVISQRRPKPRMGHGR